MTLPVLTMTGIDERTDPKWLKYALRSLIHPSGYSALEFGILRSPKAGTAPRYPGRDAVVRLLGSTGNYGDFAFHLCGTYAEMVHCFGWTELADIMDFKRVGRVQVNHARQDAEAIMNIWQFGKHIDRPVIMQHSSALPFRAVPIHVLQDQSGGRGVEAAAWVTPSPLCVKAGGGIGYAGGLSPDNIAEQIPKIIAAAKGQRFWIDCETGVRTDDWFDTVKAEAMIRAVHAAAPHFFQELRL